MRRGPWLWIVIGVITLLFVAPIAITFAAPDLVVRAETARRRGAAGLVRDEVTVDGITWAVLDRGEGEPVVMVHGFNAHKDHWDDFAAHLGPRWRAIAPDLPGWGESTRTEGTPYGIEVQAERLHAFLGALGVGPAHLLGNSMGGAIVGRLAADHPEDVRTLTLLDPAFVPGSAPSVVQRMRAEGDDPLVVGDAADFSRLMSLAFVEPPFLPPPVLKHQAALAIANQPFAQRVRREMDGTPGGFWDRVVAPTLVLWGAQDKIIDVSGAALLGARVPGSEVVVLETCGHAPMLEQPEETAATWLDFVERHR